jgi:hypothetical protein
MYISDDQIPRGVEFFDICCSYASPNTYSRRSERVSFAVIQGQMAIYHDVDGTYPFD